MVSLWLLEAGFIGLRMYTGYIWKEKIISSLFLSTICTASKLAHKILVVGHASKAIGATSKFFYEFIFNAMPLQNLSDHCSPHIPFFFITYELTCIL